MVRKCMGEPSGLNRRIEVRRRVIVAAVCVYQSVLAFALKPDAGRVVDAQVHLS